MRSVGDAVAIAVLVAALGSLASEGWAQGGAMPKPAEMLKQAVKQLDLNTASEADLGKLPGLGTDAAKKIVAGRPFKTTDELVSKKILTQQAFDRIKDLVAVTP
jgi:DNA uptake protein ComE-like DNA-binding protein